jgi:hypothetical protein
MRACGRCGKKRERKRRITQRRRGAEIGGEEEDRELNSGCWIGSEMKIGEGGDSNNLQVKL